MADFFSRLAGRAMGLLPAVRPDIAPIWAPQQAETETEAVTPLLARIEQQRPGVEHALARRAAPEQRLEQPAPREPARKHEQTAPSAGRARHVQHVASQPVQSAAPPSAVPPAHEEPAAAAQVGGAAHEELAAAAQVGGTARAPEGRAAPEPAGSSSRAVQPEPSAGLLVPRPVQAARMAPVAPPIDAPARTAALPAERREQVGATPAPSITVSIGRIEVRAVSAPARPAPQRAATNTPAVSLDEYLRSRDGNQR